MAGRWMCGGGTEPVRVVHGDGKVLSLTPPVTVADILVNHPHHYICHMSPDLPSNKSPMLALNFNLEPGYVYFLLPLPRLFPTSSAGPPSCCCLSSNHDTSLEEGHTTPSRFFDSSQRFAFSPLRLKAVQHIVDRIGSPVRTAKKKVSPELSRSFASPAVTSPVGKQETTASPLLSPTYGSTKQSKRGGGIFSQIHRRCASPKRSNSPNRYREKSKAGMSKGSMRENKSNSKSFVEEVCRKWKPGLGCILETDAVVTACQELRHRLDRRWLTFDSNVRNYTSVKASELSRRERPPEVPKEDGSAHEPIGQQMTLGAYILAA